MGTNLVRSIPAGGRCRGFWTSGACTLRVLECHEGLTGTDTRREKMKRQKNAYEKLKANQFIENY